MNLQRVLTGVLLFSITNCCQGHGNEVYEVRQEEVTFTSDDVVLAGTLYIPVGKGPFPSIAVTHGSGKEERSAGYRSLASELSNRGYVVLIYDKRGVGSSGGKYIETPDMNIPARDLLRAVDLLAGRAEVDRARIGVYGHSQGGWVAPLAAALGKNISFVMVSCGGGLTLREQILYSNSNTLKKQGYDDSTVRVATDFGRKLFTYLANGNGYNEMNASYNEVKNEPWFSFYRSMGFTEALPPPSMLSMEVFDFFRNIAYDPMAHLSSLHIPALVMVAEKDQAVPPSETLKKWSESFRLSGNLTLLTTAIVPGEDHYDFENSSNGVVYKKSFLAPMVEWLGGR